MKITKYCVSVLFRSGQMISSQPVNQESECKESLQRLMTQLRDDKSKYLQISDEAIVCIADIMSVFVGKGEIESELTVVQPQIVKQ